MTQKNTLTQIANREFSGMRQVKRSLLKRRLEQEGSTDEIRLLMRWRLAHERHQSGFHKFALAEAKLHADQPRAVRASNLVAASKEKELRANGEEVPEALQNRLIAKPLDEIEREEQAATQQINEQMELALRDDFDLLAKGGELVCMTAGGHHKKMLLNPLTTCRPQ